MASCFSHTVRFTAASLLGLAMACTGAHSLKAQSLPHAAPRVTQAIDEAHRATLAGNVHPLALARYDKGEAAASTSTGSIQIILQRSSAQQLALTQYLADVQNPHSANYHKWLTPTEFGTRFGISDADLQTLETWLQGHGFKVERVSKSRNVLQFSGSFGQVESAFHTSIHSFEVNGVSHFANISNPQIPSALRPIIAGIGPLHDFHPVSQARYSGKSHYDPSSRAIHPDLTLFDSSGNSYLYVDPADAATIYDTPNATLNPNYTGTTYDGAGINIGVIGDSNITMQDVVNYRVAFLGETAANANLPTVIVDGVDPGINGDEGEALLDNEIAGGLAPKAKLYYYVAANTDLQTGIFDAFVRAIDDNQVSILNLSFGGCEAGLGTAGNAFVLELMQQAAAQGISVTVSSGDNGSAGCDSDQKPSAQNGLAVNGLSSTPYNISVGGTDYDVLPDNFATYATNSSGGKQDSGTAPYYRTALSYIPERPWNNSTSSNNDLASNSPLYIQGSTDIVAGSGGSSSCTNSTTSGNVITCQSGYAKPAFQSSLTPSDNARDLPDISFLAANGLYQATWAICADNVANGSSFPPYTDCETNNGAFTSSTSFSGYGGTSAAAPTMAGVLALIEQKTGARLGQADYVLYQLAKTKYSTIFHDITEGNNSVVCTSGSTNCSDNGFLSGYDAAAGYDLASGLGSVDVAQLANNWDSAALTNTTTTLKINGSTAAINVVHGTSLTFEASLAPTAATGQVGIIDDANETADGPKNNGQTLIQLNSGTGTTTYNGLPGGSYTVYGYYGGDTSNAASTSNGIPVTITAEDSTVALIANLYAADGSGTAIKSLSNVPYGSYLQAQAQILGKAEGTNSQGIATGTISLQDNGTTLASNLPMGAANSVEYESPTTAYPAVFAIGAHSVTASYAGDASYKAGTSTPFTFTVVKGATAMSLTAPNTTISSLAAAHLTIGVGTTSAGTFPTGTVTLSVNGKTLSTFTSFNQGYGNNGGDMSYVTYSLQGSALTAGANTITASYSGDSNYTSSTGSIVINVVQAGFSLTSSGAITVVGGATTGNTSTISASPTNGFTGLINLSCTVTSGPANAASAPACSLPASVDITGATSASATLSLATTSSTTSGSYVVTVTGADATTGKITATTNVNVTVTGTTTTPASFALSNSGNITVAPGAATGNTSTITVTPAGGFTGTVNLSCAVTTSITNPVGAPTCSLPASVSITGTTAATATLTVNTTAGTSAANKPLSFGIAGGGAALAALLFLGVPKRRRWLSLALVALALGAAWTTGCGGSSGSGKTTNPPPPSNGTTAGTYSVAITATDAATGKITGKTTVTVTVN